MNNPTWFPSVPLWVAVDPAFCLLSYFSCIDGGIYQPPNAVNPEKEYEDIDEFTTKKFIADFHDIVDFELISTYKEVFTIYWDWDNQTILISDSEAAWESEFISLIPLSKMEREEQLITWAENFIDALLTTLPTEGQFELFTNWSRIMIDPTVYKHWLYVENGERIPVADCWQLRCTKEVVESPLWGKITHRIYHKNGKMFYSSGSSSFVVEGFWAEFCYLRTD